MARPEVTGKKLAPLEPALGAYTVPGLLPGARPEIGLEGVLPTTDRLKIHIRNPVTVFAERRSQFFCRRRRVDT